VATMTVGNLVALRQTSFKRMLAYSSIAHTGYLLVGVTAATPQAGAAILFYLAAYGAMNMGAFAVFIALARGGRVDDRIEELAGLGRSHPLIALVMTACMLSLVGFPPLGGFVGKLYLFQAALAAGQTWLVVIALVNSVISAVYYLSVVRTMYFEEDRGGSRTPGLFANAAIGLSGAVVLMLGLAPSPWLGMASRAVAQVVVGP
jgi:NADH-quinone oxidoreductase subunit N